MSHVKSEKNTCHLDLEQRKKESPTGKCGYPGPAVMILCFDSCLFPAYPIHEWIPSLAFPSALAFGWNFDRPLLNDVNAGLIRWQPQEDEPKNGKCFQILLPHSDPQSDPIGSSTQKSLLWIHWDPPQCTFDAFFHKAQSFFFFFFFL